jgi:uncharacterized CHY-type Zn-finger protein
MKQKSSIWRPSTKCQAKVTKRAVLEWHGDSSNSKGIVCGHLRTTCGRKIDGI